MSTVQHKDVTVYHETEAECVDAPLLVAAGLARSGAFASHLVYERDGKFWFAGGALAEIVLHPKELTVRQAGRETRTGLTGPPLHAVARALADLPVREPNAYGWAGFELGHLRAGTEDLPSAPELLHLVVPLAEVDLTAGRARIRCADPALLDRIHRLVSAPQDIPAARPATAPVPALTLDGGYRDRVAHTIEAIRRGRLDKAIVSRRVPVQEPIDFPLTYVRGRGAQSPARSFLLDLGGRKAVGFSPETVVEADESGRVSTQPLAGTRAMGDGAAERARLLADLLSDPKEVYEHAISVRLAQRELEEICRPDSVAVSEFMAVLERGNVQHLASRVSGQLRQGLTCWDALAVLCPAVTASGIPKATAFRMIAEVEEEPRDLYAGTVLRVTHRGAMDSALLLRSAFERHGRTWLQAGAGVIAGSRPEREFTETCEKLGSIAPYLVPRA
ncbi:salicylate synthase [Streptomyces sp. NPDC012935]|uniref:salicylate synthase n=1 Tax=Streptomyces sp. NPDC012935 TaxID=3364857 RepID=UPI00368E0F0C